MQSSTTVAPALFALQPVTESGESNPKVDAYEADLAAQFGIELGDVQLRTAGTTTKDGDSGED
ncbi:hypothetical protein ACPW96_20485 [Micromonospora sp. DT81.3]|uniref:hypothetical protein n=1 Tax=Actinomycetes TaxID=1760 RepID=UPI003CF5544A